MRFEEIQKTVRSQFFMQVVADKERNLVEQRARIRVLSSIAFINDSHAALTPSLKFKTLFILGNAYVSMKDIVHRNQ